MMLLCDRCDRPIDADAQRCRRCQRDDWMNRRVQADPGEPTHGRLYTGRELMERIARYGWGR